MIIMKRFFLFILLVSSFAFAETNDRVVLTDLSIGKSVYPGDSFNVSFRIKNLYDWELSDVNVRATGGYPLLRVSPKDIAHIGGILPHQSSDVLSTVLSVEPDAISGDYTFFIEASFITFAYNTNVQTHTTSIPVTVKVLGTPSLVADVASSVPAEIGRGDFANLSVTVWNNGSGKAKEVWLSLSDTADIDIDFPFERLYLGEIGARSSRPVMVSVKIQDTAAPIVHEIPVKMTYSDENGQSYEQDASLAVESRKEADFALESAVGELRPDTKDNLVGVKVTNTGTKKAEEIRLSLVSRYPFFATGKTFYVDNLDINGSAVVSFHVNVDENAAAQEYPVDVEIEWKEGKTEKASLERFAVNVGNTLSAQESFVDRLLVQKDPALWIGLLGILLFLGLLFRVGRTK